MPMNVQDLINKNYSGYSVRSILMDKDFRRKVLHDPAVRGNERTKELVMDKLAISGKVLLTGPTGEAKTLFARVLLDHIVREVNSFKYHLISCPFNEDAGYLTYLTQFYAQNVYSSIEVLQSLCPFCRQRIEEAIKDATKKEEFSIDNVEDFLSINKDTIIQVLQDFPVEKTIVRRSQLDPRSDPESLYMLLAGVENLEELFSSNTTNTYAASAHKVGVLSQGFVVVNEIQRLPLTLIEALMGFLEDPVGVKYNFQGQPIYLDGAIIFTSNSPLSVFGDESQPIISRVPEVLWPARGFSSRNKIVEDMFHEQLILSSHNVTPNPRMLYMLSLSDEKANHISRLSIEYLSHVASTSIPKALINQKDVVSENRVKRAKFYAALDEIHNPQKTPHVDLRTLSNMIGSSILEMIAKKEGTNVFILSLNDLRISLENYELNSSLLNEGLQKVKGGLREFLRDKNDAIKIEGVKQDIDKMQALSDDKIRELIRDYEGIRKWDEDVQNKIVDGLFPSYEQLLRVDYI